MRIDNTLTRLALQTCTTLGRSSKRARFALRAPFPQSTRTIPTAPQIHRHGGLRQHILPGSLVIQSRPFSTTPITLKKGGKAAREEKQATSKSQPPIDDPYDFSTLESDITGVLERLKDDLSKLRAGGRFNPEVLESLRVQPDKSMEQMVKLGDLAQVIPKGRTVQVIVGEKEHVKPVSSAIQGSSLSLTPQPDPTGRNANLLVINIPPPTAESRKAAVAEAAKAGEKASSNLRDARGKQQKKLRALQLSKAARPDDLKKAGSQMEKVVEKGSGELKKMVDNAKKVLESG